VATDTRRRLLRRLRRVHLETPPDVVDGLVLYYDLLRRWNEKINLTALPHGDEAIDRLLVEPLWRHARSSNPGRSSWISGRWRVPAIPLKLAASTIALWMVESKTRKAAFLREACGNWDSRARGSRPAVSSRSSIVRSSSVWSTSCP